MSTLTEITQAIERLDVPDQVQLVKELARHLKIKPTDMGWLAASEPSFSFWENAEDAVYDRL